MTNEDVKTNIISVPIVTAGSIRGYLIAQFVYTADGDLLRKLSVPPELFLTDEAFRTIYLAAVGDVVELDIADYIWVTP